MSSRPLTDFLNWGQCSFGQETRRSGPHRAQRELGPDLGAAAAQNTSPPEKWWAGHRGQGDSILGSFCASSKAALMTGRKRKAKEHMISDFWVYSFSLLRRAVQSSPVQF